MFLNEQLLSLNETGHYNSLRIINESLKKQREDLVSDGSDDYFPGNQEQLQRIIEVKQYICRIIVKENIKRILKFSGATTSSFCCKHYMIISLFID